MSYVVDVGWGLPAITNAAARYAVFVIVDVLSFCSAVDAACSRGASVYPYRWGCEGAADFAASNNAMLAVQRQDARAANQALPSLSPPSLLALQAGDRIVLPSPNGATLAAHACAEHIIAGCLRNAHAVSSFIEHIALDTLVVAAGEQWPDRGLRPALEDQLGAGAIVRGLCGEKSPEACATEAVFTHFEPALAETVAACMSGRELIAGSFAHDVWFAAELGCSTSVPLLVQGAFRGQR